VNTGVRKKRKSPVQEKQRSVAVLGSLVAPVSSCLLLGKGKFSQTTCKFVMYKHQNQDVNSKTLLSYQLVCLLEVRCKSFLVL